MGDFCGMRESIRNLCGIHAECGIYAGFMRDAGCGIYAESLRNAESMRDLCGNLCGIFCTVVLTTNRSFHAKSKKTVGARLHT